MGQPSAKGLARCISKREPQEIVPNAALLTPTPFRLWVQWRGLQTRFEVLSGGANEEGCARWAAVTQDREETWGFIPSPQYQAPRQTSFVWWRATRCGLPRPRIQGNLQRLDWVISAAV